MTRKFRFQIPGQLLFPWSPQLTIGVPHAAELLKCSEDTVLRMIEEGELETATRNVEKKGAPHLIYFESVLRIVGEIHEAVQMERRF